MAPPQKGPDEVLAGIEEAIRLETKTVNRGEELIFKARALSQRVEERVRNLLLPLEAGLPEQEASHISNNPCPPAEEPGVTGADKNPGPPAASWGLFLVACLFLIKTVFRGL
jgi:hypothetical protein